MVLTLEEAKKYLRVDGDEEDDLIASFVIAAEIYIK
ncbi:head-tail connector protein, partial [Bacillus cereus]